MDSAKPGSGQRKSQRQKKIQSPFVATDDQTKEKQASKKSSKEKPQKSPRKENHDIGSADKQATPHKFFDESDSEEEGDIDISAGNTETTRGYKPPSPSHTPSRGSKRAAHAKIATEGQAAQKKQKAVKKFAAAMQVCQHLSFLPDTR